MKPEEIHINDWVRIFLGENPPGFLVEAIIRILVIYLILMVAMRLMGKRMGSMLTRNEMIALVSLAAANGVALQSPDRGLLPVAIIAAIIIAFQRFIAWRSMGSKEFETLVLDDMNTLVKDGYLKLENMEKTRLTRERLLAQLRSESITNLGNVQRVYLEANGKFSIIQYPEAKPGLSILPNWDTDFKAEQPKATGIYACASCGNTIASNDAPAAPCDSCRHQEWEVAVTS